MSIPNLVYNRGRGRAEQIRLALAVGGIKFTETHLTKQEELLKLIADGELLFNQLPLLTWDGKKLVQTGAIVRHIARKCDLYGKSPEEATSVDIYFDGTRDMFGEILMMDFSADPTASQQRFIDKSLPRYLPVFNKLLEENGTGLLVGDSITIADTGFLECVLEIEERAGPDELVGYPGIQIFLEKMKANKMVTDYMKNIRRERNTPQYIEMVKAIYPDLFPK